MSRLNQKLSRVPLDLKVSASFFAWLTDWIFLIDLQTVNLSLRVLYRPEPTRLAEIYRFLGYDYDGRVLPSIVNEVLKSVVARYNANQLITQREQVSIRIKETLSDRLRDFYIVLDDVSITDLHFEAEFTRAIEEKQIAQQQAERAKYQVQ